MFKGIYCLVLGMSFSTMNALAYPTSPDTDVTVGELCDDTNPDFSDFRYPEKIAYCERNVTSSHKEKIYELYAIPVHCRHRYTIDHFIPLAIGGDNSSANLWPEHKLVKATRPKIEIDLYWAMVKGEITQNKAVETIVREKTKAKQRLALLRLRKVSDCDEVAIGL